MSDYNEIEQFWRNEHATIRTMHCLAHAGIGSYEQLAARTEQELLSIPNFGRKSLNEVKEALYARGQRLAASTTATTVHPDMVKIMQRRWERGMAAITIRATGVTLAECGRQLGVTPERARQIILRHQRWEKYHGGLSPNDRWGQPHPQ